MRPERILRMNDEHAALKTLTQRNPLFAAWVTTSLGRLLGFGTNVGVNMAMLTILAMVTRRLQYSPLV